LDEYRSFLPGGEMHVQTACADRGSDRFNPRCAFGVEAAGRR
jgi:hypothetical protein